MRQVTIVSLNNNAYHFDEDAYRDLRRYLRRAQSGLKNNPDRSEILADLERSIAEKCAATLNPGKNVINREDITRILHEMGPVVADPLADEGDQDEVETERPRHLCRQPQGGMLYGVCSGLAEYFGMNVVIVRIIFLALLFFNGLGGVIYVLLRIAMPAAETNGAEISQRTHPLVLALGAVLVVFAAMQLLPMLSSGIDADILGSTPSRPFWPFWGGRHWITTIGGISYLVILGVIIAVGAALVKFLLSRSGARQ